MPHIPMRFYSSKEDRTDFISRSIHLSSLNRFTVLGFCLFSFREGGLWEQASWLCDLGQFL